jgi:hypothetical protein
MPPLASLLTPRLRPTASARRFALWLATFALFVGALVPTLSRLALPDAADEWGALCQARNGGATGSSVLHEFGDACALCTLAHTAPAATGPVPAALAAVAYAPPPPVAAAPVRPRFAQARAPAARAPPLPFLA